MGHEEEKHFDFSSFYCLVFPFHKRKSVFAVLQSDINSLKSGLLHLTGQPYCKTSMPAKVKDGIINLFLRNYLIDLYIILNIFLVSVIFASAFMLTVIMLSYTPLHVIVLNVIILSAILVSVILAMLSC